MVKYAAHAMKGYLDHYSGLSAAAWQCIILSLVVSVATGLIFFLSLYFVDFLHVNIAQAGFLITCYGIGNIIGGFVGGKLSDRFNAGIVCMLSLLIIAGCYFLLIILINFYAMALNMFLLGVAAYSFKTANNTATLSHADTSEATRLRALSVLSAASNLGLVLSGVLISAFEGLGFHRLFFSATFVLLSSFVYLVFMKHLSKKRVISSLEPVLTHGEALQTTSIQDKIIIYVALSCLFIFGLYIAQLDTTFPVYVQQKFSWLGVKSFGILFVINCILVVFVQTPIVNLLKNYNKILTVGVGMFLYGFGMFLLNFTFNYGLAIIACLIYSLGEIIFSAKAQLIVYQKSAANQKGYALGLSQTVYALGLVVGPVSGGLIYHHFGAAILWHLTGLVGLLSLLMCFYFRRYD